jgi:hypothetical protein
MPLPTIPQHTLDKIILIKAISAFLHCKHPSDLEQRRAMIEAVMSASRGFCIDWLDGNDRNGCYTDGDMEAEGWKPMTLPQARSLLIATLLED